MEQVPPAAKSGAPQLFVWLNEAASAPETPLEVIDSEEFPVFVTVIVFVGLAVPVSWSANTMLLGVRE